MAYTDYIEAAAFILLFVAYLYVQIKIGGNKYPRSSIYDTFRKTTSLPTDYSRVRLQKTDPKRNVEKLINDGQISS